VVVVQVGVADGLQLRRAQVVVAADHRWEFQKKSAVADPPVAVAGNHRYSVVVGAGRRGVVESRLGVGGGTHRLVTNQSHSVDDAVDCSG